MGKKSTMAMLSVITALLLLWSITGHAALIKGVVQDSATSAVIKGVAVQLKGTAVSTITDGQGKFSLTITTGINDHYIMYGNKTGWFFDQAKRTISWGGQPGTVRIYSMRGEMKETDGPRTSYILPRLADGMYVMEIGNNGNQQLYKVIMAGEFVSLNTMTGNSEMAKAAANGDTLTFAKSLYNSRDRGVATGDTNLVIKLTFRQITHGEQLTLNDVGPWSLQGVAQGAETLSAPPTPTAGYFRLSEWQSQGLIPNQTFVGSDSDLVNLNNPANKGGRLAKATLIDGFLVPSGTYVCQFRNLLSIYCQSFTSGDYLFRGCRFRNNVENAFNAAYSTSGFHIYIHYCDFGGDGPNDWQDGGGFIQLVGGSNHRVLRSSFLYIGTAIQPNVNGVLICENYIDKICYYYGDLGPDGVPGNSDSYHLNGVSCEGGLSSLQILRNKILVPSPDGSVAPSVGAPNRTTPQTDCIALFQSLAGAYPGDAVTGIQVRDNYLGGSGYVIYAGGAAGGGTSKNIKVTGNKITTKWWTNGGNFGALAYPPGWGTNGNENSNNTWADDYGTGGNGINPTSARQYPNGNGPRTGTAAF